MGAFLMTIKLTIQTYNQLPAMCRKIVQGKCFALVSGVWREVEFPKKASAPRFVPRVEELSR